MPVCDCLEFVKVHDRCHNCLRGNHKTSDCLNMNRCVFAKKSKAANLYLHINQSSSSANEIGKFLMPIVKVKINNSLWVNAGLDNFSSSSFVTKGLVDHLNLKSTDKEWSNYNFYPIFDLRFFTN